jgi:uncharacterized protein (UPF0335 family)
MGDMMDGAGMVDLGAADEADGGQLRAFIERIEHLEAEKRDIADLIKEVYAEAKATGKMTMPMRLIVKERRQDPSDRAEVRAMLDLYRAALGMA